MKPEQLKQIITIVVEGLEQKIEGLSSEISTVKKSIPNVDRVLSKLKVKQPIYGKDWKLTREEIETIAEKIKPIAGRDFVAPKDGKDAEITDELISRIAKMVQDTVVDGEKGDKGDRGEDGIDGIDGSPDDPEVIVDKLNMTEGGVDWKVLKNFDSLVNQDTLKRAIQTLENQTRYLLQKNSGGLTVVAHDSTLTGDGTSGNPLSVVSTGGTPASPDTSIQFNNAGAFGGSANFTWDNTLQTLTISQNIELFYPSAGSLVLGADTGNHTMTGTNNILIGGNPIGGFSQTGVSLTSGEENTFIGRGTGRLMTSASRNVIIGSNAGSGTGAATVSDNVVIGRGTGTGLGLASGTAVGNVLIGQGTGTAINANFNVAIGYQAMANSTGLANIAIGPSALASTTSGINIGIGDSVGQGITTGTGNILIGSIAGNSLVAGSSHNTMIGYQTGTNSEGDRNTFVGSQAGTFPLGNDNTAIGYLTFNASGSGLDQTIQGATVLGSYAMSDPRTGADNTTAIGFEALKGLTTGGYNTVVGAKAGIAVTTGFANNFFGEKSGYTLTTGDYNVGMGRYALGNTDVNINRNIGIGYSAGYSLTADDTVMIGYGAGIGATSATGAVVVGSQAGTDLTTARNVILMGYNAGTGVTSDGGEGGVIAIGRDTAVTQPTHNVVLIGRGATTGGGQEVVFGSQAYPLNNLYFGEGKTVSGASLGSALRTASQSGTGVGAVMYIKPGDSAGADQLGANMYIYGGASTGTGYSGTIHLLASPASTTGSSVNSHITIAMIEQFGITIERNLQFAGNLWGNLTQVTNTNHDFKAGNTVTGGQVGDFTVALRNLSAARTINLPQGNGCAGLIANINDAEGMAGTYNITIDADAIGGNGEYIEGASEYKLTSPFESVTVQCGTDTRDITTQDWTILSHYKPRKTVRTVTATTDTPTKYDEIVLVDDDTAGAAVTVTLPGATVIVNKQYTFKKLGSTATVTIFNGGASAIDGQANYYLTGQYDSVTVVNDGTYWWVI